MISLLARPPVHLALRKKMPINFEMYFLSRIFVSGSIVDV